MERCIENPRSSHGLRFASLTKQVAMHVACVLVLLVVSLAQQAAAMDWVIYSSVHTCFGAATSADLADYIMPATLTTEPRLCFTFGSSASYYLEYLDDSKRAVDWFRCPSGDCGSGCHLVETAVVWQNGTTLPCGPTFLAFSSYPALAFDEMESSVAASGVLGKLGNGQTATSYSLQTVHLSPTCSDNPVTGIVQYFFERCSRVASATFALSTFSEKSPSVVTRTCSDQLCSIGCNNTATGLRPASNGLPSQCSAGSAYSRQRSVGRGLASSSRFSQQLPPPPRPRPLPTSTSSVTTASPTWTALPTPAPSSPSSSSALQLPPGAIVGIAFASAATLGAAAFLIVWRRSGSVALRDSTSSSTTITGGHASSDPGPARGFWGILSRISDPKAAKPDIDQQDGKSTTTMPAMDQDEMILKPPPPLPPTYQEAQRLSQQSVINMEHDHDNEQFGIMELADHDASNLANQHFGVLEITGQNAVADVANQQFGVMEASYIRRTA
ncbi:hypothetical protein BC831DRAFT_443271 [Entophlyctis helioformis]|nr:hypothetical protein BC831DRAFT_443271 [Entophlyctis helioformis]